MLSELLYADYFVLMSKTVGGLSNKFIKWMEVVECKGLKFDLWKTKVMNSGSIKDGLSKSNGDPCEVCSLVVKASSVLCVQCGRWFHSRCAEVRRVFKKFCLQEM